MENEIVSIPDSFPYYALYKGSTLDSLFLVVLEHSSLVSENHLSMGESSCNIQKDYSIVPLSLLIRTVNLYNWGDNLCDLDEDGKIMLKWILKKYDTIWCALDSFGLGQVLVAGLSTLHSVKGREFLDWLTNY